MHHLRSMICIHAVLQAEPFAAGVRRFDFDQSLAPYNLHAYQQWQNLSGYISQQTISKLSPLSAGNISITAEADPAHLKPSTPAEKKLYAQLQEGRNEAAQSGAPYLLFLQKEKRKTKVSCAHSR